MSNKYGSVQVHRFGDQVSAYLGLKPNSTWGRKKGQGVTVYMSPGEAIEFAHAILGRANEIEHGIRFTDSKVGTYSAEIEGDKVIPGWP